MPGLLVTDVILVRVAIHCGLGLSRVFPSGVKKERKEKINEGCGGTKSELGSDLPAFSGTGSPTGSPHQH